MDHVSLLQKTDPLESPMRILMLLVSISYALAIGAWAQQETSSIGGPEPNRSVAAGTLSALQVEGVLDAAQGAPTKTWMRQLALQKLSRRRMRRVYLVEFTLRNGEKVAAVAETTQSSVPEESGLVIYVVSKVLQSDGKPVPRRQ